MDNLSDDEESSIFNCGYMFLTYLAEASGLYDARNDLHETFSAEDEGRVIFLYVL